jgi:DNA-binding transcriptional ArsR family regulator
VPRTPRSSPITFALDRTIHEPIRLGIISTLAVKERLSFNELKDLLGTTDGNVSVHARKLEDAGYISCHKGFEGRVPHTDYKITAPGRRAMEKYFAQMLALIEAATDK